jgi:hypothetical protein
MFSVDMANWAKKLRISNNDVNRLEDLVLNTIITQKTGISGLPMAMKSRVLHQLLVRRQNLFKDECWNCSTLGSYSTQQPYRCANPYCNELLQDELKASSYMWVNDWYQQLNKNDDEWLTNTIRVLHYMTKRRHNM